MVCTITVASGVGLTGTIHNYTSAPMTSTAFMCQTSIPITPVAASARVSCACSGLASSASGSCWSLGQYAVFQLLDTTVSDWSTVPSFKKTDCTPNVCARTVANDLSTYQPGLLNKLGMLEACSCPLTTPLGGRCDAVLVTASSSTLRVGQV